MSTPAEPSNLAQMTPKLRADPGESAPRVTSPNTPPRGQAIPTIQPGSNIQQLDDAFISQGDQSLKDFKALLQERGEMNLFAMLGNAFALHREPGLLSFFFDPTHANLIPMLRMPMLFDKLKPLVLEFFRGHHELRFQLAHDPATRREREADMAMQETLQNNPRIRFLIDQMNATLIRFEKMDKESARV